MFSTPRSVSSRVALAVTLLLPAAFLGACTAIGGNSCQDNQDELKRLAAQPLLDAAPTHATAPTNYHGQQVTTACDDDSSGKPWLHADRVYAFPGSRADVVAHYTEAASAAGWQYERDPSPMAAPDTVEGACWTRTDKGRHLLITVDFRTDVSSPPPQVGTGIAYEVSIGTTSDGSNDDGEATCWH
ncbi:hypothetical protein [Streptomyces griseosporeus]|uniref:hypothetical protein n=1 Tax=Streptomyces griseosporeus TaxID=1910 RepID=UPI0036FCAC9B